MPKYCLNWVLKIAGNISCQNNVLNASIWDPNVPTTPQIMFHASNGTRWEDGIQNFKVYCSDGLFWQSAKDLADGIISQWCHQLHFWSWH